MFKLPSIYLSQKQELLRKFDDRLQTRPDSVSKYDVEMLEERITQMNFAIKSSFLFGIGGSLIVLWNLKGVRNLNPIFKGFAILAPPVLAPLYSYLTQIQKIQGLEAFLAIKYQDLERKKGGSV